ncbi:uncharacterized protein LOC113552057 [Rhopalosiphum maidis]|uniref:uncharacterized protein LOC113552057 n=1 Tax=Rhopalosiphum maidis TaxID=43146 RepID=UPI000EFDC51A|nr:uncharacterized protein LOC113552057 [Rhopalosiphum maidis]
MMLSSETVNAERQREHTNEDGGGDNSYEFEEKILRAWLEKYIEKYNKNIQPSTGSTNIQRIAKKSRTSTFKMPMLDHEHITALSMYPFLINPLYQPSIYSSYIPLLYDATTHLIPIGQVPYQKEEYHHRFFGPLHTQFPIGYTNVQGIMSSTLINNDHEVKETVNVLNSIPPGNQEVIKKYDNESHTQEQILNQSQDYIDHTSPQGLNPEELIKNYQKKVDKNEQQNSKSDRKLLDQTIVDDLLSTVTADQNQMSESYEIQDLQPMTTTIESNNTSMTLNTINLTEIYQTSTISSLNISNKTSKSKIYSKSASQLSLSSDQLVKHINLPNHSTTQESTLLSNTKQLETTVKTFSSTTDDENQEITLTSEERSRQNKPQKAHHYSNHQLTADILKGPTINIEEISTEMAITRQDSKLVNKFPTPPLITTTTLFSTPLCENNDCKITSPTHYHSIPFNDKEKNNASSDQELKKYINGQDNIMNLNSSPRRPSAISIFTSKTSTLSYPKTYPAIILTSSQPHPKYFSSTQSPYAEYITDKNNKIQPTSLRYTSLLPTIFQPLNINNIITTSVLEETKTEQTPSITMNSNKCTNSITQNSNALRHHDDSTRPTSTSKIIIAPRDFFNTESLMKTIQNNLTSDINMYSNSYQSPKIPTATKKSNTHKDDNINNYLSITTEETKRSSFKPTVMPIKQYNSAQKKVPLITDSDDSKFRKSTYNQETLNSPRSTEDSELWYNHMYPQNPLKKEPNEEQIHFLLKKIIKLLKPEIEKQTLTKESVARLVPPRLGDPEKFVYIIYPWVIDAAKNMENEERTRINANLNTTSDKL